MSAADRGAKLDRLWGDAQAWTANGLQWQHLPEIRARIRRRITGDADLEPLDWFFAHARRAAGAPLRRVLVLGCGHGGVERVVIEQGWASAVVAMDFSPRVVAEAGEKAAAMPAIRHVRADLDHLPVGEAPFEPGTYDAVIGIGSVHHCARLPELYAALQRLLVPGGWLYLDEYVGPSRFQFPEAQLRQIRRFVSLLPARMRTTFNGAVKSVVRAPTVEEVIAFDPSEAACSAAILPLLPAHFEVVRLRPYGGALLHLLLADIAQHFLEPGPQHTLRGLIEAEEELGRLGQLSDDFACVIARARTPRSVPPNVTGS